MMKKRSSIVVLIPILIMIFVFLGCNTSVPQGTNIISRKYETDYEDYFNYLQPYLECMDVDAYYETEEGIDLYLTYRSNYDMEESFADVIEAHNLYVLRNDSYFPKDFNVSIREIMNGKYYCYSNEPSLFGLKGDISQITVDNKDIFQYCLVDDYKVKNDFDIPTGDYCNELKVLAIEITGSGAPGTHGVPPSDYTFLSNFPNLQKLILITDWDYDSKESFYCDILAHYPDLEIYTAPLKKELIPYEL